MNQINSYKNYQNCVSSYKFTLCSPEYNLPSGRDYTRALRLLHHNWYFSRISEAYSMYSFTINCDSVTNLMHTHSSCGRSISFQKGLC